MKPLKLELQAFGPYVEKQTVDFEKLAEKGMFLITGNTGSGKTTIFDAMTFALYGGGSGERCFSPIDIYMRDKGYTDYELFDAGLIKKVLDGVKVLGGGELTKKLTVSVDKVTESAKQKIEAIGGKVEVK